MSEEDDRKFAWNLWVESRPDAVREVARRFKPWHLYRLKSSGHFVIVYSIGEPENPADPVELTVAVLQEYNGPLAFERRVFGIPPDDLEFARDLSAEGKPN